MMSNRKNICSFIFFCFLILPYTVKAESEPTVCNSNYPKILCVPIPYTKEEISKMWDSYAKNQYGGNGDLTNEGVKKIKNDCPHLCSKNNATWKVDGITMKFHNNGEVSFLCSCEMQ